LKSPKYESKFQYNRLLESALLLKQPLIRGETNNLCQSVRQYRLYPPVSNNVGIDFTELGPPHDSKLSQAGPKGQGPEKQDDLTTLGFRVKPKEKAIIQD
jgi:hypothetical protein